MLALAIVIIVSLFAWQGNKGFQLWDEGFLWYGVQQVMLGEVPIRDFMAYDPGRYYWSAAFMSIWGSDGIMPLRAVAAIFQTLGLFVGLLLVSQNLKNSNYIYLMLAALTFVAWMNPYFKVFDTTIAIFLIAILAFLAQNPTRQGYFLSGLGIGLAAVFGRNHGVYGVLGSLGIMGWISINRMDCLGFVRGFLFWSAGVCVGFSPIFFMALFVPGFAIAFWDSIVMLFELKTTNIPVPIPWPWRANFSLAFGDTLRAFLLGVYFIGLVLFGLVSIFWVIRQKYLRRPVAASLVAASFLSLPYAHYAYSRADYCHLAFGIFPLLVGSFVFLATQSAIVRWSGAILLCASSIWIMHIYNPGWQAYVSKHWVNVSISGSNLKIDPDTAQDIALLRNLAEKYAPNGESFVTTPFWPGAYALLERKSPMWEIYALFPRSQSFEEIEIAKIKAADPKFILVWDMPLDLREDRRFRNTHPLVNQYIENKFEQVEHEFNPAYHIYVAQS